MRHVALDIESDGLLDQATKIHCLVLRDLDTDEVLSCTDSSMEYPTIREGLEVLRGAERVYMHNGISFDRPALKKLTGYEIPWEKVRDTRVIAAMRWAHAREMDHQAVRKGKGIPADLIGKHSLEAWGYRLGILKGAFKKDKDDSERWAKWTPEMQAYCEQDTAVTAALVKHIQKHGVSAEAVETEQELALYLAAQERNGWPFSIEKAAALQGTLVARREYLKTELTKQIPRWVRPVKKKGEVQQFDIRVPKCGKRKHVLRTPECIRGTKLPATRIDFIEFNPGSRQHIADRLITLYGWKPTEFTPSGLPEINEKTLAGLPSGIPGVDLLKEYLLVEKRLGQLAEGDKAWLRLVADDRPTGGKLTRLPHIHHSVLQSGTVTHRAAHFGPNVAQVPKVGSPYGAECRSLFVVPKGWVLVGADASSLEGRCGAHYTARYDGGAFGRMILGGDIHNHNRDLLARVSGRAVTRDTAKTWFYAFLYGAGDEKLGRTVNPDLDQATARKLGARLRKQFLASLPGLKGVVDACKALTKSQGWLRAIDGRRVYVRSEHSALNTLLQSAGAIICKRWIVHFNRRLVAEFGPQGWGGKWAALGWIHDEVQIACRPEIADRVKEILVQEIEALTQHFNWRVALTGEAKVGSNWAETH